MPFLADAARVLLAVLTLASSVSSAEEIAPADKRSGYDFMGPDTRAMQDDDTANPGMLWVLEGEDLWSKPVGAAGKACATCHGDARTSMKGVAARYPAFDDTSARPVSLESRINLCRTRHQQAPALTWESRELLALEAYVANQSRGHPITPPDDPRLKPFIDSGDALFHRRQGQLNLSCSACHDRYWGRKLAGSTVPQGHATGYPLYRLEWQGVGSLQRRLRGCFTGVRTEAFPYGADEYVALELYLMRRGRGLAIETPAVRP